MHVRVCTSVKWQDPMFYFPCTHTGPSSKPPVYMMRHVTVFGIPRLAPGFLEASVTLLKPGSWGTCHAPGTETIIS